jgi:hypothetical protein
MSEKCDICNEYEGTERQVMSHKIHCAKKAEVKPRGREETEVRERIPFGVPQSKLNKRNGEDGYMYYTFNDNWQKEPGRVQRAESAGYERTGKKPVIVGSNEDGSAIMGVEMRIPKKFYDEDQAKKQEIPDRIDEAIKKGTLESKEGDNRYVPDGIRMWSSNNENK